jgi:hypothetical protein
MRNEKKVATSNVSQEEKSLLTHFINIHSTATADLVLATENEPLDTWDEEETILTPDGDNEEEVR